MSMDDQTLTADIKAHLPPAEDEEGTALVIAWSREEPDRVGERLLIPGRGEVLIGRGPPRPDDPVPRLTPGRLRPGGMTLTGPLLSRHLSRRQLRIRHTDGGLDVTRTGRCAMRRNGGPARDTARLVPGDVLELEGLMLLLAVRSPAYLTGAATHPFGHPDEHGIVGEAPASWELRRQLRFVGPRQAHVLLLGASGVGKELAAQAVHALSDRRDGPLISRNAATLPEGLLDAELFGNIRNYPHAGMPERPGLVGAAHEGSLFLDELAELPQQAQSHLLRVLDSGEHQPLGSAQTRTSDFRLIGATNRDPEALKHDVLARLPLIVRLPDLNARREDIPLLLRHILQQRIAADPALASSPQTISPGLLTALLRHTYTTHVRELSQLLWQSMLESSDGVLREPAGMTGATSASWQDWVGAPAQDIPPEAIQACLDAHNGNQEQAAQALGLSSRHVLGRLIKRHQLIVRRSLT